MQVELTKEAYAAVKDVLGDFISESDGKHVFEAKTEAEISGQQSALKKERKRAEEAEKKLKTYGDLDPDEARDAIDQVKGGKLKTDEDVQKAIKAARKEGETAKAAEMQKDIDRLSGEVSRYALEGPLKDAALKAGMMPNALRLALKDTQGRFKLDGDKILVVDADGDATGKTVEDFWSKDYKTEFPNLYAASGSGGSGATQTNGNGANGGKTYTRAQLREVSTSNPVAAAAMMKEVAAKTATLVD